jgi:hypothetical protein
VVTNNNAILTALLFFILFVHPQSRPAKQRRRVIAESRSGRSENVGERDYELGNGDKHNLIVPSDAT